MAAKAPDRAYRKQQQEQHRAWLRQTKVACERCGQSNYETLRIVDRETGEGAGVNGRVWWLTPKRREEIMAHSEVVCATCMMQDKKERG